MNVLQKLYFQFNHSDGVKTLKPSAKAGSTLFIFLLLILTEQALAEKYNYNHLTLWMSR